LHKRGEIWHAVWWEDRRQRWQSTGLTNKDKAQEWLEDRMTPLMAADRARALRAATDDPEREAAASASPAVRAVTVVLDEGREWHAHRGIALVWMRSTILHIKALLGLVMILNVRQCDRRRVLLVKD